MLVNSHLVMNENRMFGTLPVIKLGSHFKKVPTLLTERHLP